MAVMGVNQLLKYTETSKMAMHQKAMRTLLGNESRNGKDALFISVDAGAGTHHYILQENGKVVNVNRKIEQLNSINWLEAGYREGDTFSVYGKEYVVDSSGHINVSAEEEFTATEIVYPSRER